MLTFKDIINSYIILTIEKQDMISHLVNISSYIVNNNSFIKKLFSQVDFQPFLFFLAQHCNLALCDVWRY